MTKAEEKIRVEAQRQADLPHSGIEPRVRVRRGWVVAPGFSDYMIYWPPVFWREFFGVVAVRRGHKFNREWKFFWDLPWTFDRVERAVTWGRQN